MKKRTLTNLLIVSATIIFTACSGKAGPEKKAQSIESIIALQQARINSLPLAQTYPIEEEMNINNTLPLAQTYPIQEPPRVVRATYSPLSLNYSYTRRHQRRVYSNPYALINKIEWNAKRLLGKKYVWGATGPYCYDCSGFTQKVFRDAGINLPRVSRDQAKVGEYVDYAHLRKGDMVFFDTHKKRTGKVTHVGIYLGNGNFIHASSGAKKVVIFNFNKKKFYRERFLWGRRVINTNTRLASL